VRDPLAFGWWENKLKYMLLMWPKPEIPSLVAQFNIAFLSAIHDRNLLYVFTNGSKTGSKAGYSVIVRATLGPTAPTKRLSTG